MGQFGTGEILLVLAVVLLLFGSTKLPQLARSLGKSARILKAETKGLRDDDETPEQTESSESQSARDKAAQLREEAARLEREAAGGQAPYVQPQRTLPSGEPIQGVPLDRDQARKTS
ncbi:Sec-independent protein translocase subunit TatA [Spirillospora sp. CA-294931]|uniref:Sec-independent protein translocase subunit TatA n=1 Tax=Spirillospora sp. CA-294931 TaxID=3240042 RepID=UPI003D926F3B